MTPEEKEAMQKRLAPYLAEYVANVAEEWMRIVEIDEDAIEPGSGAMQLRARWFEDHSFKLGTYPESDDFGYYRLNVSVEPYTLPPMGPENDPALAYEQEEEPVSIDANPEPEVYVQPDLLPCGAIRPCESCLAVGGCAVDADRAAEPVSTPDVPEWIEATWVFVENGDRVRLDGQEGDVLKIVKNNFHAAVDTWVDRTTGRERDNVTGRWDHVEVTVELAHLPGRKLPFPPNASVEVLMNRERKAIHLLATELGGKKL